MSKVVTIKSPRGGLAFVDAKSGQVVHYKPSVKYRRMKKHFTKHSHIPITVDVLRDHDCFRAEYMREQVVTNLVEAAFNKVHIPCNDQTFNFPGHGRIATLRPELRQRRSIPAR